MREILFRGRQKGGTEWFYGDLSYLVHDKQKCYIFPPDGYNSPDWYEVDPDTVGQYIGMLGRNGKRIFEGDIIKYVHDGKENIDVVEYKPPMFSPSCCVRWSMYRDEVIGNKWDNPELLEATP